jgi:hypothetical protein
MAIDVPGVCPLVQVYDMPTSVKFYRDTLGFQAFFDRDLGSRSSFSARASRVLITA